MTMPRFTAVVMTMLAVYWYAPALIAQEIDSPAARARDIRITDRMIGYDPADTDTTSIRNDTLAEIIATVFANKPAGLAQFTAALKTKLDGIEAGARGDLTGAEIISLIDSILGTTWKTGGGGGSGLTAAQAAKLARYAENPAFAPAANPDDYRMLGAYTFIAYSQASYNSGNVSAGEVMVSPQLTGNRRLSLIHI